MNSSLIPLLALGTSASRADLVVDGTRVVYPESRRDVSFNIRNVNPSAATLAQLWLDDGDAASDPEKTATPFLLSPNVARIAPNGRQTVRLTYTGEPLSPDEESLFWFNMLELPPSFKGAGDVDRITFARRTRIKVFFRPKGLKGDPFQAMKQLACSPINADGAWALECYNPSSFHLSFFGMSLGNVREKVNVKDDGGMIRPKERMRFMLGGYDRLPQPLTTMTVDFVNDYGALTSVESTLRATP